LELEFMVGVAEAITHSALRRTESRGSHQRSDFPKRDDEQFLKHSLAFATDSDPRIDYRDVVITSLPPGERVLRPEPLALSPTPHGRSDDSRCRHCTIMLEIARYRPGEDERPTFQRYEVPNRPDWVVLDALNYIKDEVDGTLSYRWSCRMGICGSCGMMVNGVPKLTCAAFLRDYGAGPIRVEALANFPVERDLVIVLDDFMNKLRRSSPGSSGRSRRLRRSANTSRPPKNSRTTSNTACASTACCATPPARCTRTTRTSSDPRSSPWPSGTTNTHVTTDATNGTR